MSRLVEVFRRFPGVFWTANSLELFERWAYYGVFNLLALYLTGSQETGALGFTQVEKGLVMGIVNAILYFLPVITGAIADRFGYKKVLFISFIILSSGYYLMGIVSSFTTVFLAFFYVAIGAALFKPIVSATIARTTDEQSASVGFGIFYMIINMGGMIGPFIASELREIKWQYIFIMSASAILLNIVLLMLFYKEPGGPRTSEAFKTSVKRAFINIYITLKDFKFLLFLLIIVGGWTVYWQFFYSLPVFIEQWISTSEIYHAISAVLPKFAAALGTSEGTILAEKLITLDALFIVFFQVPVSTFLMRYKPINTMIIGLLINVLGLTAALLTSHGWILILSIFIFSLGEMSFSPKILEYISRLAPKDKAGLYMGSYFLPMACGNILGGLLSGKIYELMADKYTLLHREVIKWGLDIPRISDQFTKNQFLNRAAELMGMDHESLTRYLWLNYYPSKFGFILLSIGVITVILLIIYDKIIFRYK